MQSEVKHAVFDQELKIFLVMRASVIQTSSACKLVSAPRGAVNWASPHTARQMLCLSASVLGPSTADVLGVPAAVTARIVAMWAVFGMFSMWPPLLVCTAVWMTLQHRAPRYKPCLMSRRRVQSHVEMFSQAPKELFNGFTWATHQRVADVRDHPST